MSDIVHWCEELVYGGKQSAGVGGARVNDAGVEGGTGFI